MYYKKKDKKRVWNFARYFGKIVRHCHRSQTKEREEYMLAFCQTSYVPSLNLQGLHNEETWLLHKTNKTKGTEFFGCFTNTISPFVRHIRLKLNGNFSIFFPWNFFLRNFKSQHFGYPLKSQTFRVCEISYVSSLNLQGLHNEQRYWNLIKY